MTNDYKRLAGKLAMGMNSPEKCRYNGNED